MTAKTLAVYHTSPYQPFLHLPGRLKQFSRGIFALGVWGRRFTWLAPFFLTHKARVAWGLHCLSSRGHGWKASFGFKPQRCWREGCSAVPLHTYNWQQTFLQGLLQTLEIVWLEGAITGGHGKGRNSNLLFTSLLNLGNDRSTFPSWQSLRVSSDIYVTGKAYNMYTVV